MENTTKGAQNHHSEFISVKVLHLKKEKSVCLLKIFENTEKSDFKGLITNIQ